VRRDHADECCLATSGAHFFNVSSSINDSGALIVSYDEASRSAFSCPSGQMLVLDVQQLTSRARQALRLRLCAPPIPGDRKKGLGR
jgi:hypothetical protein